MPANQEIEDFKNTKHKLDLTDIYRNSTQQQQNSLLKYTWISRIFHIMSHKWSLIA